MPRSAWDVCNAWICLVILGYKTVLRPFHSISIVFHPTSWLVTLQWTTATPTSCNRGFIPRKCFRGVLPQLLPHHPHQWTMLWVASPVCHRSLCLSAARQQMSGLDLLKGNGSRMTKDISFPLVSPKHVPRHVILIRIYAKWSAQAIGPISSMVGNSYLVEEVAMVP